MGISGQWKAKQGVPYSSPLKQGTGWNAVHNTASGGLGRGIATHETLDTISPADVDAFQPNGYDYEADMSGELFGDNPDHPNWGTEDLDMRSTTIDHYPSPGPSQGVPMGTALRSQDHGSVQTVYMKAQQPPAAPSDGYKLSGSVENATVSDPDQYVMQTSMRQRDQVRNGSQAASGRANAPRASIPSRIPGQRIPTYTGSYRHAEMTPKSQDVIIRPFFMRTAGTPNPDWMEPNAMFVATPMTRQTPPLSDTGDPVGQWSDSTSDGYTDEDTLPYV